MVTNKYSIIFAFIFLLVYINKNVAEVRYVLSTKSDCQFVFDSIPNMYLPPSYFYGYRITFSFGGNDENSTVFTIHKGHDRVLLQKFKSGNFVMKLIRQNKSSEYIINSNCDDYDIFYGDYACKLDFDEFRGKFVNIKFTNDFSPAIYIDAEVVQHVGGCEVQKNNSYSFPKNEMFLIYDLSKCYLPNMTVDSYNKIGMSLDCYNDYRTVRAIFSGFKNHGEELSFLVTLTALGDDFIKVEVQDNEYENKPNVMPYYHKVEKSHGYVFVDMYIFGGLLIGDKTYHYDGISLNSSSKITPIMTSDDDSCPMVLSIPDDMLNYYTDYQNKCENVTRNFEFTKIWENVNWDDFNIYSKVLCNEFSNEFKFETINNRIEFMLGIYRNNATLLKFNFGGIPVNFEVSYDEDGEFKIEMSGASKETIELTKKFGSWKDFDILPVLITQDHIVFGREKRILYYGYAAIRQLSEITVKLPSEYQQYILFIPKEYEKSDKCEIFSPESHYMQSMDYHYLSPKLCKAESSYTIETEGYLHFLFGIEKKCFENDTIVNGTILNETFSIVSKHDKKVFIFDGKESNISMQDIQKKYGYMLIGVTLYPKYYYIGNTLAFYDLEDSEYVKDLSFVNLTMDDNSCDFMFVIPKNESDLYNIDECDIPDKMKMPNENSAVMPNENNAGMPNKNNAGMPREETWFLITSFSYLFISVIIYVLMM